MKKSDISNIVLKLAGAIGLLFAVIIFSIIVSSVDISDGDGARNGIILFISFIMCSGLAFSGLIIMALTQISTILSRIEKLLNQELVNKNDKNK